MDELNPESSHKESIFKVYKNRLSDLMSKNKPTVPSQQPSSQSTTQPLPQQTQTEIPKTPSEAAPQPAEPAPQPTTAQQSHTIPQPPIQSQIPNDTQKTPTNNIVKTVIKLLGLIIAVLAFGYAIVNYQSIALKISYWYNVSVNKEKWSTLHPVQLVKTNGTAQKLDENYLYIPTLGIQAPIIWGAEEKDANGLLSQGLVQYAASALPDDAIGNIYISGNTSGPIWQSSPYKTVFTLLDKVTPDSIVTIIYKNKIYSYRIIETTQISNSKVVIAPGNVDKSILNLLAKYPIGLNWNTFLVKAELFKIESNIVQSMQDKIDKLMEQYNETQLGPIKVTPTPTIIPTPSNKILDQEILPDHFLPNM